MYGTFNNHICEELSHFIHRDRTLSHLVMRCPVQGFWLKDMVLVLNHENSRGLKEAFGNEMGSTVI